MLFLEQVRSLGRVWHDLNIWASSSEAQKDFIILKSFQLTILRGKKQLKLHLKFFLIWRWIYYFRHLEWCRFVFSQSVLKYYLGKRLGNSVKKARPAFGQLCIRPVCSHWPFLKWKNSKKATSMILWESWIFFLQCDAKSDFIEIDGQGLQREQVRRDRFVEDFANL